MYVALYCSCRILFLCKLHVSFILFNPICSNLYFGTKEEVFQKILLKNIFDIDSEKFKEKSDCKGCNIPLSESYILNTQKLQNSVSSLMFGEAFGCSGI